MQPIIRYIQPGDNARLAYIVRHVLKEFNANKPGTAYFESTTDNIYELFQKPGSAYLVAELNGEIIGGSGIYLTDSLPYGYCELVKLYLLPVARGNGLGKMLIEKCLSLAKEKDFTHIYLESMSELSKAVGLYERLGFKHIDKALGNSSHSACGIWMVKAL
jgi:putative acetyltransferase